MKVEERRDRNGQGMSPDDDKVVVSCGDSLNTFFMIDYYKTLSVSKI